MPQAITKAIIVLYKLYIFFFDVDLNRYMFSKASGFRTQILVDIDVIGVIGVIECGNEIMNDESRLKKKLDLRTFSAFKT